MGKGRSQRVLLLKEQLIERLRLNFFKPGEQFYSSRYVAESFDVSHQTAYRVIQELTEEGHLYLAPYSRASVIERKNNIRGVALYFQARAQRKGSFGDKLYNGIVKKLKKDIEVHTHYIWMGEEVEFDEQFYPVFWETEYLLDQVIDKRLHCLLLNGRPSPGLHSELVDSIDIDDLSGAAMAAELLEVRGEFIDPVIVSGPNDDSRNLMRVQGFQSRFPEATVYNANSWHYKAGYEQAGEIFHEMAPVDAIFCCNDRLAAGVATYIVEHDEKRVPLIGFDNGPISEKMNIATVAIPWEEVIDLAVDVIKRRVAGNKSPTVQHLLGTRPVARGDLLSYVPAPDELSML